MCGIAGILFVGEQSSQKESVMMSRAAEKMMLSPTLKRRGPDYHAVEKIHAVDGTALGFLVSTRLAVTDRKNIAANMPMTSTDENFVLVYNGQIYNYKELRRELELYYSFRTQSDTEVILAAYQQWGNKLFDRLDGMYAFCLVDRAKKRAVLAVDHAGQKPLVYSEVITPDGSFLVFASDISTLMCSGIVPLDMDDSAFRLLTAMRYVPGERTAIKNVSKMAAGCYMTWSQQGISKQIRHYTLDVNENRYRSRADVIDGFNEVIDYAYELVVNQSEVPPAFLLSAGVDSSALAALNLQKPKRDRPFYFTAKFSDDLTIPHEHDEVRKFLNNYNQDSYKLIEVPIDRRSLQTNLQAWGGCAPDFIFSRDMLGLYSLLSACKNSDQRVVVTGCGPDEILEGYSFGKRLEAMVSSSADVAGQYLQASCFIENVSWERLFYGRLKEMKDMVAQEVQTIIELYPSCPVLQTAQLVNWHTRSQFECMKTDAVGSHFGIEARKPYYSRHFADLSFQFPAGWKIENGIRKKIFREAIARNILPEAKAFAEKIAFSSPTLLKNNERFACDIRNYLHSHELFSEYDILNVAYLLEADAENPLIEQLYVYALFYDTLKSGASIS